MTTEYADNRLTEQARERLAEEKKRDDRSRADAVERLKGKPTPTQEENDMAALGAHILMHEHDGSVEQPTTETRHLEAERTGSYQTRQAAPRPAAPKPPGPPVKSE
jgi:hypothetical protein